MGCNSLCNDFIRHAEETAYRVVRRLRNRGLNRDVAIEMASESLGLTQRRIWSLVYSQPIALAQSEYRRLLRGYIRFLEQEQEELKRQAVLLTREQDDAERRLAHWEQQDMLV